MLDLYKNIKSLRKEKKMSQEDLARATGYSDRSSIAKIEAGIVDLPQSQIVKFALALDTTPAELMGDVSKDDFEISDDEKIFLESYRNSDEDTKRMIDRLLKYSSMLLK